MPYVGRSFAKINLLLAVGPRRADGFHGLVTVYHAIDIAEDVQIAVASDGHDSLRFDGPVDTSGLSTGPDNLVWQAIELVAASTGQPRPPLEVTVTKRIPIQGGMAGGSADGAATLLAARDALAAPLDGSQLDALAAQLGSDVPFALHGGSAIGTGRGEVLELVSGPQLWWSVVTDASGLSTPRIYAHYDEMAARPGAAVIREPQRADAQPLVDALAAGDPHAIAPLLRNDLQAPAIEFAPHLADTIAAGREAGALAGIVSGSGPSVVLLSATRADADAVTRALREGGRQAVTAAGGATV